MDLGSAFSTALAVLASLGGGALIVLGMSSWLGKVWANRILESDRRRFNEELERIRGELEKTIHAHRIQFETEFKVLSEIWKNVAAVRQTMGGVRPTGDIVNPDEDPKERLQRRLKLFQQAFHELIQAVDYHGPLYPENIHKELSAAIQIARYEESDVLLNSSDDPGWHSRGRANFEEFLKCADRISDLIRARLAAIRVS